MAYVAPEEPKKKKQKTGVQFSTCIALPPLSVIVSRYLLMH